MSLSNIATERALLAGLFQHGQTAYLECVDILKPEIFTDTQNALVYTTIKSLLDRGVSDIDLPSFYSEAAALSYDKMICDKQSDKEYIKALLNYSISVENVRSQAAILFKLHAARMLQDSSKRAFKALDSITGAEGLDHIIGVSEREFRSVIDNLSMDDGVSEIGSIVDDYLEFLEENEGAILGIPTPFPIFNNVIGGGLRPGVGLIVGRAKAGKSSLGKETAYHCASNNIPTLIIDTEMSSEEQIIRLIARMTKIPMRDIEEAKYKYNPVDRKKINIAKESLKALPLTHINVAGKDFSEILAIIKRWLHKKVGINPLTGKANPHVVIYDYFKMMNSNVLKDMKEYEALGYQISALHDMCKMYDTPVLSFGQTNRDGITSENEAIVAASDRLTWNCISLSVFKRKTPDEIGEDGIKNGNVKLIPILGRFMNNLDDGDYINMNFDKATNTITELGTKYNSLNSNTGFEVEE